MENVIGEHQALTGASSLMLSSMLCDRDLVKSMIEYNIPSALLRGLMTCTNIEISGTVIDVLTEMIKIKVLSIFQLKITRLNC